jgi:glycerol-1-phosphate dehydrogenase [NAD(P)+]
VLHGEQVALGCLVAAAAHDWPQAPVLLRTFRRLGLPTSPEDLAMTRAQLVEAVLAAPQMRPGRWTVLSAGFRSPEDVEQLLLRAFDDAPPSLRRVPSVTT